MRLTPVALLLVFALAAKACASDYDGGGRRHELPTGQGGAGGAGGSAGSGLIGSSDSGASPDASDAAPLPDCPPPDSGYPLQTGDPCVATFDPGTQCRRSDGADCLCRGDTLAWDCVLH